jgi:flagellar biosynthesis protein FlhF
MELQRILAKDTRAAMRQIHHLYGDDALVVSNNKARGQTEIIVAVDLDAPSSEITQEMHYPAQKPPVLSSHTDGQSFDDIMESQIFDLQSNLNEKPSSTNIESDAKNEAKNLQKDYLRSRELLDLVKQELASIREEVRVSQRLIRNNSFGNLSEYSKALIEGLNNTGMPLPMRILVSDLVAQHKDDSTLIETLSNTIGSSIGSKDILSNLLGVHIINGPTGVGKTTMANRIAKQVSLEHGKDSVAIISFNDDREGAWDQSQLLGLQLGINIFSAQNSTMLKQLIKELSSRRLIIVDAPSNNGDSQLQTLQLALPDAQLHLLLPADASPVLTKQYINIDNQSWNSLMISRLEEGIFPWPVLHALLDNGISLSIASASKNVANSAFDIDGFSLAFHGFKQLASSFN